MKSKKLRTLVDVCAEFSTEPEGARLNEKCGVITGQAMEKRIKELGIEWIRALDNKNNWVKGTKYDGGYFYLPNSGSLDNTQIIKYFCGLTDKDLKLNLWQGEIDEIEELLETKFDEEEQKKLNDWIESFNEFIEENHEPEPPDYMRGP